MILKKLRFRIRGMDCAEEVSLLRRKVGKVPGVRDLTFDVIHGTMFTEYDPAYTTPEQIRKAIESTGMRGEPWSDREAGEGFWRAHARTILTAVSGLSLLAAMLLHALSSENFLLGLLVHQENHEAVSPTLVLLCLVSIITVAFFTVPKAIGAARQLTPDMNVLMCISVIGAMYLGEWLEGATLSFLYTLANSAEAWSLGRARKAIGSLIEATPGEAMVVHDDHEHRTPVSEVPVGATVRVRPGAHIPFDGEVQSGTSGVNQAIITGESVPILKRGGDRVFAGTMNGEGVLDIRTTRQAMDTVIARIVRMVSDSTPRRAPSEQFVQKFARIYTPAVIALAVLVATVPPIIAGGGWTHWFYQGMVILLISCPCALVISTPVSIVAALASAARQGVLIKGGAYLETAAKLNAMAFDKTGVLTTGEPEVRRVAPLNGHSAEAVLERVTALEWRSEHPLGKAIVRYAKSLGIKPADADNFQALPGRGARAEIGGGEFWAGSNRMLEEKLGGGDLRSHLAGFEDSDHTLVFCGSGNEVWAALGIEDRVRPDAAAAIQLLRADGIACVTMLTGDNKATARAVARQLAIDDVRAELMPQDKALAVSGLIARHGRVAMVGDGVNDAQAMSASSLGIALGRRSTDLALETADVIIMNEDLTKLHFLLRHSRRALAVIQQNIAFSLVTKALFLMAALFGAVNLWMAVAADMGATLVVTANGLRMLHARGYAKR